MFKYSRERIMLVVCSAFFIFTFLPAFVFAENIDSFHVIAHLQKDGIVKVSERIDYDFDDLERHGIFREIPLTSELGPRIIITPVSINDEVRRPYRYSDEGTSRYARWKIGDPDKIITGKKTYWLNYDVSNVIRKFDDHDEWYWNITGNEWKIPIHESDIEIELPVEISLKDAAVVCFTGKSGSTEKECVIEQTVTGFRIVSSRALAHGEGLTISVSLPPNSFTSYAVGRPEPQTEYSLNSLSSFILKSVFFLVFLVPVVIFIIIFSLFRKRKIRIITPKALKNAPVIVQYEPPKGLTPPDIGVLIDRTLDACDMAPVIIDLAVKGYLKISYSEKQGILGFKSSDYTFSKLKSGTDLTHPVYRGVYEILFGFISEDIGNAEISILPQQVASQITSQAAPQITLFGKTLASSFLHFIQTPMMVSRNSVNLSEISQESMRIPEIFKGITLGMSKYLQEQGYFKATYSMQPWRLPFFVLAIVCIIGGIALIFSSFMSIGFILVAGGVTIVLLAAVLPLPEILSEKGIKAFENALGFKEYLGMVETEKLRLLNAPELKPETFEKYLPYAMVFKVEKEWAKKFDAIPVIQPQWVEGSMGTVFSAAVFADSLSSMNSTFSSAFVSGSSNSSGGGGGGSSGGGSGGGGGGSW